MKRNIFPLFIWFGVIFLIILAGTAGFIIIEGASFIDALYMTVITVTTIGYGEIVHLSATGRIYYILLIISSFSLFTYAFAKLTQYVASGEMALYFKNRKIMQRIDLMQDHIIICGFGRNGQQAARTLAAHKKSFVVIEQDENCINQWVKHDKNLIYILGDTTVDETLVKAGIEKATALIITLPSDADNVFIVLSARSLKQDIRIISRASQPGSDGKLAKAGANSVIMPDKIGGTHMATLVSKPDVIEFIDYLSGEEGESIHMESVAYSKLPPGIRDKTLRDVMEWKKTGVNCIGIKTKEGKFVINPPADTLIQDGMRIIVLGNRNQIDQMKHNVEET